MTDQSQLDFTDRPAVRSSDPDTSHEAFHSLDVKGRQKVLMDAIRQIARDFTCSELAYFAELPRDSVSPRLPEIERRNLIRRTDRRRSFRSNRRQIVWELT